MAKRRAKLEVIYDILSIIKEHRNSIRATPLLRLSNLSSERFQEYFSELLAKGFVREINGGAGKLITLTDKGFRYLDEYKMIVSFIEDFGLSI